MQVFDRLCVRIALDGIMGLRLIIAAVNCEQLWSEGGDRYEF